VSTTWDTEHGCAQPGSVGRARHVGAPLDSGHIRALEDGEEIVVTWSGGNGPHAYRVLVDSSGTRCVESLYADPLLPYDGTSQAERRQARPLNRVTRGWDEVSRQVAGERPEPPGHVREAWAWLRRLTG
jgi:hypothetical protein